MGKTYILDTLFQNHGETPADARMLSWLIARSIVTYCQIHCCCQYNLFYSIPWTWSRKETSLWWWFNFFQSATEFYFYACITPSSHSIVIVSISPPAPKSVGSPCNCWTVISMCWFYGLNTTFSAFKPIINLNG